MPAISITISRFVDEHLPGFVECELIDAQGERHTFLEKVPIVTRETLWSSSSYPRSGSIPCLVEENWQDESGQLVVSVSTELPFHVESVAGQSNFVVLASDVLP